METTGLPLLRLGRLELTPGLRALKPGTAAADLVVTATVEVPASGSEPQYAWDVAWADAVREAEALGADSRTAQALAVGAGRVPADGSVAVVAAHGEALLAWRLPPGAATRSVRVGPLPHLREVAVAAARRPAYVVVLADRDGAAVIAHTAAALDEITGEAIAAAGDLVASAATGPAHGAVRGIEAVTAQLAEQQVGVLLVAADIGQDGDELVWAALRQDAFVVQLPDRSGSLAGEPAAALLRRGAAG